MRKFCSFIPTLCVLAAAMLLSTVAAMSLRGACREPLRCAQSDSKRSERAQGKLSLPPVSPMRTPALQRTGAARASAKHNDEAREIEALKQRVADQDRRISALEKQVSALMATAKFSQGRVAARSREKSGNTQPPASAEPQPQSRPAQAASLSASPRLPAAEHRATSPPQSSDASTAAAPPPLTTTAASAKKPRINIAGINVGGDVYLYQYLPTGVPGAEPRFELYAFSVLLDAQHGHWGFHSDYRLRTTKLRSFFPGNTWLQQGYVRYDTPYGEIRAGSFYRRVGIDWDDSFFGNIEYFDGLKLDPEFGLGFEGAHSFSKAWGAEYSAQYFSTDSSINGSLPGRDLVSEPGAHAKNDFTLRFAPVFHLREGVSLTLGGSLAHGAIDRDGGPHNTRDQAAADATLKIGPWLAYGELLNQNVHGIVLLPPQNVTYTLAGMRWTRGRFQPRFNFSQGNYFGLNARREYILQPGITIHLADGFSFIYEYDFWRSLTPANRRLLDRSSNLVLQYHF